LKHRRSESRDKKLWGIKHLFKQRSRS
jgi:hypothetical protein